MSDQNAPIVMFVRGRAYYSDDNGETYRTLPSLDGLRGELISAIAAEVRREGWGREADEGWFARLLGFLASNGGEGFVPAVSLLLDAAATRRGLDGAA